MRTLSFPKDTYLRTHLAACPQPLHPTPFSSSLLHWTRPIIPPPRKEEEEKEEEEEREQHIIQSDTANKHTSSSLLYRKPTPFSLSLSSQQRKEARGKGMDQRRTPFSANAWWEQRHGQALFFPKRYESRCQYSLFMTDPSIISAHVCSAQAGERVVCMACLYTTKGTYETTHLRRGGKGWFSEIMV